VNPTGSVLTGGLAGLLVVASVEVFEWFRLDDPVGAVSVHAICGIWGTLSLGLFACGKFGATGPTGADNSAVVTGLLYGGGVTQLIAQFIGSASIGLATFVSAFILMKAVDMMGILRVSREGELEGLDNHEHGGPAYPEYALNSLGTHVPGHPAAHVSDSLKAALSK
jgi:Amt family ammonium transporter